MMIRECGCLTAIGQLRAVLDVAGKIKDIQI
jgi:hypothetical protein